MKASKHFKIFSQHLVKQILRAEYMSRDKLGSSTKSAQLELLLCATGIRNTEKSEQTQSCSLNPNSDYN